MAIEPFLGTRAQRIFLSTIALQAAIVLGLVAAVLALVDNRVDTGEIAYKTLPCYFALFALAEIFELVVSVDALRLRNIIQLVGILIFHGAMLVMACIQIQQTRTALVRNPGGSCDGDGYATCDGPDGLFALVQKILIVVPVILGVTLLVLIWVTRELFAEFGWAVFHAIGADPSMKNMYQMYQIMICLLKFDFFAFVGLTMQLIIIVLSRDKAEFGLTIAAIPIVFVLLIFCGIAVQREIKWLMTFSLVLMLGAQAYFIYKLYRFYTPPTADDYSTTRGSLTTFCIFSLILLFATFGVGVKCFVDFDKGLRQSKTFGNRNGSTMKTPGSVDEGRPGMVQQGSSYFAGGAPLQQRISIE